MELDASGSRLEVNSSKRERVIRSSIFLREEVAETKKGITELHANGCRLEVSISKRESVVPSPPCAPHVVTLSSDDHIIPPIYTIFLYFFPAMTAASPDSSQLLPTPALKRSLARALAAFPPVAGRLTPRDPAHAGFDVHCNNQGAVFVEAHAPATLHQLLTTGHGDVRGSAMYQPSPLWTSLAPDPAEIDGDHESKPLLLTQVTRLSCGGAVLAVVLHHHVADGTAQSHFVTSWAELARGEEMAALPHLDRSRMKARTPPSPSFEHTEYLVHKQAPSYSSAPMVALAQALPPPTSRIFEFLHEDIRVLKDRAIANAELGGVPFTGFQVLAGHIWKHVSKARGIGAAEVMKLGWTVNGRKRFHPPLPPTYFGNVVFSACTERSAGEVLAQPLHNAAKSIRSATQRITHDYMQSALDLVAMQTSPFLVTPSFSGRADLTITSWAHLSSYEVDFGGGRPVFFAPADYGFTQLVVLLPHPSGHSAVNALICMFEPDMQSLLSDRDFYPLGPN